MSQPDEAREYAEIAKDCLTTAELDEIAEHLKREKASDEKPHPVGPHRDRGLVVYQGEAVMDITYWFLAIMGGFVTLCATAALFAVSVNAFLDWRHEPHQRSYYEGGQDARNRLMNDAWWFSESPETCELLRNLGRGMNVSDARDKWRKARFERLEELIEEKKN